MLKRLSSIVLIVLYLLGMASTAYAQQLHTVSPFDIPEKENAKTSSWYDLVESSSAKDKKVARKSRVRTGLTSVTALPASPVNAYGFADEGDYYQIPIKTPTKAEILYSGSGRIFSGVTVAGTTYGARYAYDSDGVPHMTTLMRLDSSNGKMTPVANFETTAPIIVDMTWSPVDNKVYCIGAQADAVNSSLYTLDIATGKVKKVCDFDHRMYSIASDSAGKLFTITPSGELYVIMDPSTGKPGYMGKAVVDGAKFVSSMDIDWTNNTIYWAMTAADKNTYLVSIDPRTAAAKSLGTIGRAGGSKETAALNIPKYAAPAEAPAQPEDVKLEAVSNKAQVTLSWKNPSKTNGGATLEKFTVRVYANNTLLKEYADAVAGEVKTETLTVPTGYVVVRVVAESDAGTGTWCDRAVWVGTDIPDAPTNLRVTKKSNVEALLEWDAPQAGQHGGYFDATKVKYRIERVSVEETDTILAKTHRATQFTDNNFLVPGVYHYRVQALTTDYGGTVESADIAVGPSIKPPYVCTFNSKTASRLWTRYDVNADGQCWTEATLLKQVYNWGNSRTGSDDWLVTYPLELQKDSTYYLYFEMYTGLGFQYPKDVEITIGRTVDYKEHKLIGTYKFADKKVQQVRLTVPVSETGDYYIGIHDKSPYSGSSLTMTNFVVIVKETGFIAGTVTDPDGNPMEGVFVEVPNSNINCTTKADGKYLLDYLPKGEIPVRALKHGWVDHNSSVAVENRKTTAHDITMTSLPRFDIGGTVLNDRGNPVRNARVNLYGYGDSIVATTNEKGAFLFEKLPSHQLHNYILSIRKQKYYTARDTIKSFNENQQLEFKLVTVETPPACFKTERVGDQMKFSWEEPREEFRYDNGVVNSQCGTQRPDPNAVFGTVFREPMRIKAIKWVTSEYLGPHNEMNLWIFKINESGVPVSEVIWNKMHAPAKGDVVWNVYELPEPVDVPHGCFVAVSYSPGMASLAWDNGTDPDWPFQPGVNFESLDYTKSTWRLVDGTYNQRHHLLRVECDEITSSGTGYEFRYNLWRARGVDMLDREKWVAVASDVADTNATDNVLNLPDGEYYYILEASLGNGRHSRPVYSDALVVNSRTISGADGVDAFEGRPQINPNPVRGTAFLSAPCDRVEVFTTSAALVLEREEAGMKQFDVSSLQPGMYLVRFAVGNRIFTSRMIVE